MLNSNVAKYTVAKKILEKGIVKVHCDPRLEGVHVPPHLSEDPVLLLQFAYGFQLPSFQVDEEAISGVLNFNGLRYHCIVPWESVFALTAPEFGHEGHFWPEDVPREMMESLEASADETEDDENVSKTPVVKPAKPVLAVVGADEDSVETGEEGEADEDTPPENHPRPLLRIVRDDE